MSYLKDLRISDLDSSAVETANLIRTLSAIRNTAEKAGHEELAGKAAIWMDAAEALSISINQALNIEREADS